MNRNYWLLGLIITLVLATETLAALPQQLIEDFAPLKGYVVMPIDDQYLTDLDATKGLHIGDILSIITPGEKIVHPVSGETIGTLDGSAIFLTVNQLKSGYSYASVPQGTPLIDKGTEVTRFTGVNASFLDQTGNDPKLRDELVKGLPHLTWVDDNINPQAPHLRFVRTADRLMVSSAQGQSLNNYSMPALSISNKITETSQTAAANPRTAITPASPKPSSSVTGQSIIRKEKEDIWTLPNFKDHPIALLVADLDADGQLETAVLSKKGLSVFRINNQQQQRIAEYSSFGNNTLIALDQLDLSGDGRPEIFVSALSSGEPDSYILQLENNQIVVKKQAVKMLFRKIMTQTGSPLLLGQKRNDLRKAFDTRPFIVKYQNQQYLEGQTYPLPNQINLYDFTPLRSTDADKFVYLSQTDYLRVRNLAEEDAAWESAEHFGGSETSFNLATQSTDDIPDVYYVPPRLLARDSGELLTIQNDGQRIMSRFRLYLKGRIVALSWDGNSMVESWRTSDQNGYIADFTMADIDNDGQLELATLVLFKHGTMFNKPRAAVVIYEL